MNGFRLTRIGISACLIALLSPYVFASEFTEPRPSRYAGQIKEVRAVLAQEGLKLAPDDMEKGLSHSKSVVRVEALWGLAATGAVSKAPAMKRLLTDPDANVRVHAIYALDDLQRRFPIEETAISHNQLVSAAKAEFTNANGIINGHGFELAKIQTARMLLEVAGDGSGYKVVMGALTGQNALMRAFASSTAQLFAMKGVRDESGKEIDWVTPIAAIARDTKTAEVTRIGSISALVAIGSPQAKAVLSNLAQTETNPRVRAVIVTGLAHPPSGQAARDARALREG